MEIRKIAVFLVSYCSMLPDVLGQTEQVWVAETSVANPLSHQCFFADRKRT